MWKCGNCGGFGTPETHVCLGLPAPSSAAPTEQRLEDTVKLVREAFTPPAANDARDKWIAENWKDIHKVVVADNNEDIRVGLRDAYEAGRAERVAAYEKDGYLDDALAAAQTELQELRGEVESVRHRLADMKMAGRIAYELASRPALSAQGPCETTGTMRFKNPLCKCPTYQGNLGPCIDFEEGGNGRCVYCDHEKGCHDQLDAQKH